MRPAIANLKGKKNLVGAEIGVYQGKNALDMLKNLDIKKLYLVDPFVGYDDASQLHTDLVVKAKETSIDLLEKYKNKEWCFIPSYEFKPKERLDFVYIDADHRPEYVYRDMEHCYQFIKKGGMLGGHDWDNNEYWDVQGAVKKFAGENNLIVNFELCDWWLVKK
jgi:hypothetical protein